MRLVPTPIKGWRNFAGEVGIIVLGVLIALGAQQVAEEWQWQRNIDFAENALRQDALVNDVLNAEAITVAPCVLRQIDLFEQRLTDRPDMPVPVYADAAMSEFIIRMPDRTWIDTAWRSVNSDETVRHLDADRAAAVGAAFGSVSKLNEESRQMQVALAPLNALSRMSAPTPSDQFTTVQQAETLRRSVSLYGLVASQQREATSVAGMLASAKEIDGFLAQSGTVAFCKAHGLPLGRLPPLTNKESQS